MDKVINIPLQTDEYNRARTNNLQFSRYVYCRNILEEITFKLIYSILSTMQYYLIQQFSEKSWKQILLPVGTTEKNPRNTRSSESQFPVFHFAITLPLIPLVSRTFSSFKTLK